MNSPHHQILCRKTSDILIQMGVAPGQTVMEAGTGSGSMTIALATPSARKERSHLV
ncbi:MAG: hypothetical protein IPO22_16080 [Anaerolineales bacterium]|nr:hypothetical protein [Anaerolineales bacterium]